MANTGQYDSQTNIETEDYEREIFVRPEAAVIYGGSVVNSVNGQVGDVVLTTSDLENTSDYQTGAQVQNAIAGKQNVIADLPQIRSGAESGATAVQPEDLARIATTGSYNDSLDKPSINNVALIGNKSLDALGIQHKGNYALESDIPDVSSFITNTVDNLINYYKKSETFTKQEVNDLISAITTMDIRVVQTLPTEDISTTTIYFVPKTTAGTNDVYDEYIYVSNAWEHIGSTDIDLSGYQTKIDSSHKLSSDLVDDTNQTNKFVTENEKTTWNTEIENLQEEDELLKRNLQTTTGSGEEVTLEKTTELDFVKPPLPRGNTKQDTTTGKNLLQNTATSQTINGVTFTINSDKSITCNGTATANTIFRIVQAPDFPDNKDMLLTGCPVGGSSSTYQLQYSNNRDKAFQDMGNGIVIQKMDYNTYPNTYVQIRIVGGYTCNNLTFYPMIRLATIEDDTYEPYTGGIPSPNPDYPQEVEVVTGNVEVTISNNDNSESKTLPVSLGNIELCKIGNYQDYLYKNNGKWYKHNAIKKLVLNGSENWSVHGTIASWFFWDGVTDGFTNNNIIGYALSNYFTQKAYSAVLSLNNGEFAYGQVSGVDRKRFVIKDTDYTTVADFKSWLSTHNTIVYYVLATPTDTEITDTTLISQLEEISKTLSYQGQTNITSNTIALFDVEAYQSTKLILEDISDELDTKVSNTDYAGPNKVGVIKTNTDYGTDITSVGALISNTKTYQQYLDATTSNMFISKGTLENVITGKGLENKYSRSEIKTGTWIDNKPVYRRFFTIDLGAAPNIAQAHSLTDLDKFWINQSASFVFSSYESLPSTWYYSSADWARTWMTNTTIRFRSPVDLTNRVLYVAVEYTKTTD